MHLWSYGQFVTRARYLEIPVNTTQSADFQSYDWRPALLYVSIGCIIGRRKTR